MNQHIAYHAAGIKTKQSIHPSTFRSRRVIPSRITFTMARNGRLGIIFVLQLTWSTVHISLVSNLSSYLILSSFRFHIQHDRYSVTIPHFTQYLPFIAFSFFLPSLLAFHPAYFLSFFLFLPLHDIPPICQSPSVSQVSSYPVLPLPSILLSLQVDTLMHKQTGSVQI